MLKVTEIFSNKPLVSNGHSNAWSSGVFKKNPRIGFAKKKRRKNLNSNYYFTKSDQHGSWFNSYSNSTNTKKIRESHFTCSQTFIFLFNHCPMHEQNKSRRWEKNQCDGKGFLLLSLTCNTHKKNWLWVGDTSKSDLTNFLKEGRRMQLHSW